MGLVFGEGGRHFFGDGVIGRVPRQPSAAVSAAAEGAGSRGDPLRRHGKGAHLVSVYFLRVGSGAGGGGGFGEVGWLALAGSFVGGWRGMYVCSYFLFYFHLNDADIYK